MDRKPRIIAISGSLRANSSNNAVINTALACMASRADCIIYDGLGSLPHFNDAAEPGPEVTALRQMLRDADGVFICSPEYAFGVPGSLKNALDWTVSSGELVGKPLALITAATGGQHAHAALLLTFTALSSQIPDDGKLIISYVRSKMDANGAIKDPATIKAIHDVADALLRTIETNSQQE